MKSVAIDFETANSARSSVCAMGVAVVHGQRVVERASWLIRPPELRFDPYNVYIHGITEGDVADKPEFDTLWERVRHYFDEGLLLAHHASFDMSVLRQVLDVYGMEYPEASYLCTRIIAKRTWPKLISYSLPVVAEHIGVQFTHHNAEEDAVACAEVALRACADLGVSDPGELAGRLELTTGKLFPCGYAPCGVRDVRVPRRRQPVTARTAEFDRNHPFFAKTVVFTGTLRSMVRREAMQRVVDCGGICSASVGKSANYLVLGDKDFVRLRGAEKSNKLRKAEALIARGADLEIIPEAEFLELLGG